MGVLTIIVRDEQTFNGYDGRLKNRQTKAIVYMFEDKLLQFLQQKDFTSKLHYNIVIETLLKIKESANNSIVYAQDGEPLFKFIAKKRLQGHQLDIKYSKF